MIDLGAGVLDQATKVHGHLIVEVNNASLFFKGQSVEIRDSLGLSARSHVATLVHTSPKRKELEFAEEFPSWVKPGCYFLLKS